jgi:hypothetical protein
LVARELQADEQPPGVDPAQDRVPFLQRRQLLGEVAAQIGGPLDQLLRLVDIQGGVRGGAGERRSRERADVRARPPRRGDLVVGVPDQGAVAAHDRGRAVEQREADLAGRPAAHLLAEDLFAGRPVRRPLHPLQQVLRGGHRLGLSVSQEA